MMKRAYELEIGDLIIGFLQPSRIVQTAMNQGLSWVEARCEDGAVRNFGWFIGVEVFDQNQAAE